MTYNRLQAGCYPTIDLAVKELKHLAVDTDKSLGSLLEGAIQDIAKKHRKEDQSKRELKFFYLPRWPLQNTPPVAGSKYPTPYGRPIEKTTRS